MNRFFLMTFSLLMLISLSARRVAGQYFPGNGSGVQLFEAIGDAPSDDSTFSAPNPPPDAVAPLAETIEPPHEPVSPSPVSAAGISAVRLRHATVLEIAPDERIPVETSALPEDRRPILIATRRVSEAIAVALGHDRWTVMNITGPGMDSRTDPPSQETATALSRARLILVDNMPYSDEIQTLLKSAPATRLRSDGASVFNRAPRPSGILEIGDVAAGSNFSLAKRISDPGRFPEPIGGRISEAITMTWALADQMTQADPAAGQLYFDRAWEFSSQLMELRATATERFHDISGVEFWVTDGYALALLSDIGLPVDKWIDRAWLTMPSGARLKQLVDDAPAGRRIIVLTTRPSASRRAGRSMPPLSKTLKDKLDIHEVILKSMECDTGRPLLYKQVQAWNYDRIYDAVNDGRDDVSSAGARTALANP